MAPEQTERSDSSSSRNDHRQRGPNVLILSAAGKPIFARYGSSQSNKSEETGGGDANEEEWATCCGILQGLRANILSFGLSGLERGAARVDFRQADGNHNEAWLRLQLEYVYSQIIFTLTSQVQEIFKKTPGYDLRSMMGQNVNSSIRNLLDRFDPVDLDNDNGGSGVAGMSRQDSSDSNLGGGRSSCHGTGCGSFLTAGVECVHPIPPEIRENASKMLIHACGGKVGGRSRSRNAGGNALFAMLVVGTRLVTIIQPSNPTSQLHTSDLHLILTFVGRQPGLLTNELWFPLCLPRFDSSGFLYAYTSCLDPMHTGLSIVMISPDNSTKQFESFRHAANTVRTKLGLPSAKTKVLRVFDSTSSHSNCNASTTSSISTAVAGNRLKRDDSASELSAISGDSERRKTHLDDAAWKAKAQYEEDQDDSDELYDDEDNADSGRGIGKRISAFGRPGLTQQLSTTCYLDESLDEAGAEDKKHEAIHDTPLLTALKVALSAKQQEEMMTSYLQLASAVHFVFRCDIYVSSGESTANAGAHSKGAMLTQCFGPPLSFPFIDASSQSHVWDVYQRLSLRLRLGSSSVETTADALDMIAGTQQRDHYNIDSQGISRECPMQCLLESPPNVHSVTYLQEDNEWLYVGLNGKFFECYATLPATIPPKTGTAYCARLVRRLMGDERILFLSNPLTW
eukprot:CAMPEP_0181111190 /NCGR_PEP_ID=MMETSP1071-20121207/19139_1 /TAXON_ID=35127 /ORGANISM="Thalassiosira sp., Strain NH16" /LENGTH=682 /DNA_ID=CAMNT_0023195059 /DNA_START=11 /DNA_END=2057 /DNA_ORIENTATION=-